MKRAAFFLVIAPLALVLTACEDPPLVCGTFAYDEVRMACVCPADTVELSDGSCLLPDGGTAFPPGLDAGPRPDAQADAGIREDSGIDAGVDAACSTRTFFRDSDSDGAGDPDATIDACESPAGYVENDDDCDDDCATCLPGGTEVCDERDNDCDGTADEGVLGTFYRDADGDSFGNPTMATQACAMPGGYVENDDDCNDACATCFPGGTEVCEGTLDENCSMGVDDGCTCTIGTMRPCPGGSSMGVCLPGDQTCTAAGEWGACVGAISPMAETCNSLDDDCDGTVDGPVASVSCGTAARATGVACSAGTCFVSACSTGYLDCDANFSNGCEAQLGTVAACTACGDTCRFRCDVGGCNDAARVVAGENHTCVLLGNGEVMCWGDDSSGQLGNDTSFLARSTPVRVAGLSSVMAITAGARHTCALRTDGTIWCWGSDASGQLGNGATAGNQPMPGTVSGLTSVSAVSAGGDHTCALTTAGSAYCWGSDSFGQVGNGATTGNQQTPVLVSLTGVTAITAGISHTCALNFSGAWCWGSDSNGQLGDDGTFTQRVSPTRVTTSTGLTTVARITAGGFFTCALSGTSAWCWGADSNGQLGNDPATPTSQATPVRVTTSTGLSGATEITTGNTHACALDSTNGVWCWGSDSHGQLGNGDPTTGQAMPVRVTTAPTMGGVTGITAGGSHSCASGAGAVWCWGRNSAGQIGDGTMMNRTTPVSIVAP